MPENTIPQLPDPLGFSPDPFTDVLRDGARKLIEQAIHAELTTLMNAFSEERFADGRARLVRHGHLAEREVMTGIGPVPVKVPRVRDRGAGEDKITFTPSILPRYLRKAKSVEDLLPWLYLKGLSTGDFTEAPEALLGPNAKGLSAKTITRLKADWWADYEAWQKRDLGNRRFLYIWADGVYFKPRMADEKQCVLVIVGADEYGRKELLTITDGFRESTQSWREVLLDLKRRGLKQDPKLAIGDGALGFWTALREVFATTREQRCRVHKTMNVLNAMPKSMQARAKGHLHHIWQAETKAKANVVFDFFVETYGVKWDKAVAKLVKDRDALLATGRRKPEVKWAPVEKAWKLPGSWLNRFVDSGLERYGRLYVVQPYREMEKCAPACRNAVGHDCQCSCMGANHGAGDGNGWFDVSETFSFRWGPQSVAIRLMTQKA